MLVCLTDPVPVNRWIAMYRALHETRIRGRYEIKAGPDGALSVIGVANRRNSSIVS